MPEADVDPDQLIRDAYAVVAEPEKLFDLQLRLERAQQRSDEAIAALKEHIDQVGDLFDTIHLGPDADYSRMALMPDVADEPAAHAGVLLVLARGLVVESIRQEAFGSDAIKPGEQAPGWLLGEQPETERQIGTTITSGENDAVLYVRLYASEADERGFMALGRVIVEDGKGRMEFTRVSLDWQEEIGERFAKVMGLSETEKNLAGFIVSGQSVSDFADARGRSVGTARNQLKTIQRKLGIGSQSELVSLYAGFANSLRWHELDGGHDEPPAFGTTIALTDGSEMRFERYGKAGGRPVVLLHGAIEGPFMPHRVQQAAQAAGLELFVPWMPYFADTDRTSDNRARIERFVSRLDLFCAALRIEKCGLLACSVSCAYGFAASKRLPHRFSAFVAFALPVPLDDVAELDAIHPMWRAPLVIGRKTPGVVEMLVRTVVRLAMRGEAYRYFDRLLKDSPVDHATLRRPDVAAVVRQAFINRPDRAQRAMAHALLVQCLDWSDWLEGRTVPARLMIAEFDSMHSPEVQLRFCDRYGIEAVGPLKGLGGFTMYQDPARVFAEVNAALDA